MRGGTTSGHEDEEVLLTLDWQAAESDAGIDTLARTAVIVPSGHDGVLVIVWKLQLSNLTPCSVIVEARCLALGKLVFLTLLAHF